MTTGFTEDYEENQWPRGMDSSTKNILFFVKKHSNGDFLDENPFRVWCVYFENLKKSYLLLLTLVTSYKALDADLHQLGSRPNSFP